ncbi:hypothetical protein GTP23_13200 [Pseudoduganella sp. FT93W]|uniref:KAP NTPase domain-containing protein n=1 Tax=Duganella fentianensis TaxID=2692177 RepID=A0A845I3X0_9BURK|nr:P-loop NTPase fold protein [Duganella fentianensis]MYN46006.1 hypothetical protein [Duganella fentianensis]
MVAKIIEDIPTDRDSFNSHEPIANAIWSLMTTSEGGKSIGLDGAWGSGKSSIIKILEKKISEESSVTFIYKFDAWTHQGEPLRRAFVNGLFDSVLNTSELLTEHLDKLRRRVRKGKSADEVDSYKKQENKLEEKLDKLKNNLATDELIEIKERYSKKSKVVEKFNFPKIDRFGRWLIFIGLLIPVGLALVSSGLVPNQSAEMQNGKLYAGAGILFLPFVSIFLNYVRVYWNTCGSLPSERERELDKIWTVFQQKTYLREVTTTVEDHEPTTIEFQKQFKDFLSSALAYENFKIVIVLDNFDRLPAGEVEEVWAVLRSFVDNSEFSGFEWFKRFWVVIPCASSGITLNQDGAMEGAAPHIPTGFLDKVIQVSFAVPYPTISDFKSYLRDNLILAFGDEVSPETVHNIFILISQELSSQVEVTPRIIISIINNMVSTALQWPTLCLESHALFSILRRKYDLQSMGMELMTSNLGIEKYPGILGEEISSDLAVLIYNVEREKAIQKLYVPLIDQAMNDRKGFEKLREFGRKIGFLDVLASNLSKGLSQSHSDPAKLLLNINNLICSGLISEEGFTSGRKYGEQREQMVQDIYNSLNSVTLLSLQEAGVVNVILTLVNDLKRENHREAFLGLLKKTRDAYSQNNSLWFNGHVGGPKEIVFNVNVLRNSKQVEAYIGEVFLDGLSIPGPVEEWVRICDEIEQGGMSCTGLKPAPRQLDIWNYLADEKYRNWPVRPFISAYRALVHNSLEVPLRVVENFIARVKDRTQLPVEQVAFTLPFLYEVAATSEEVKKRIASIDNNVLYFYLGTLRSKFPNNPEDNDNFVIDSKDMLYSLAGNIIFLWIYLGCQRYTNNDSIIASGNTFLTELFNDEQIYPILVNNILPFVKLNGWLDWQENLKKSASKYAGSVYFVEKKFISFLMPILES